MAPPSPSIQSFFHTSSSPTSSPNPKRPEPSSLVTEPGDGFTAEEIDAVLNPAIDNSWTPTQDYEESDIGALEAGPKCISVMGRIVNFYDMLTPSKRPRAAQGCIKLMMADDSGALTIKLWYANMEYKLRIGHLITLWTPHISHGNNGSLAPSTAPLFTSIFPERDRSCHIMLHENSDDGILCKKPPGYKKGQPLPGLMTLKNFVDGGCDVANGRILVCVKSIGARKTITTKKGVPTEIINIGVFDDTAEASLTLWGPASTSAAPWQPSHTILLIQNPGWRFDRKTWLSLTANTRVDVDPDITDAAWLRSFAQRLTKREHINPPFPEGVFHNEAAETAPVRILYKLADIDEIARTAPKETITGYISIIITSLNIISLHRRNMLMSTECCGLPLYANATTSTCKQCNQPTALRINPRILGTLLDETAALAASKLIFSTSAWTQLLGRSAQQFVNSTPDVLRYLEHRLLFLRLTLGFGWVGSRASADVKAGMGKQGEGGGEEVGGEGMGEGEKDCEVVRLCVWCVKM